MEPPRDQGLLRSDSIPEVGEDAAATVGMTETLSEEEQDELRKELAKVEEEIQTLSQVLAAKEKHLAEIKRKLGINSLQELKQNITKSWQDVTSTTAYKKTSETLSQAGQKASAAFSSVGSVITKKFEDVSICFRRAEQLAAKSACMSPLMQKSCVVCILYVQEKQRILLPPLLLLFFW
uniref:Tumor protein D52 n=1 Tax=Otus sunia TaxID=257818 RepID=A0A8C8AUC8_9STRI